MPLSGPVMSRHSNREESIVLAGLVRASRIKSGCPVWRSKFGQVGPNIKDKNAPARSRRDGEPVESEEKKGTVWISPFGHSPRAGVFN